MLLSFGFEDGVSQPLLAGIDKDEVFNKDLYMQTSQSVITVVDPAPIVPGLSGVPKNRPKWMVEGSFLVFRKLEQDVQRFIDLTNKFESAGCANADQFGAKLMGRWKSGRSQAVSPLISCR
jgi:deferrochelatase/peroxidase EfeB